MYKDKPSYYAIIPANVRYDKRLTDKAKLLYGEITCLTNKTGECWASNQYFADLYGVSKQTISNTISLLIKYGYITSELIYKDGGKEVEIRQSPSKTLTGKIFAIAIAALTVLGSVGALIYLIIQL